MTLRLILGDQLNHNHSWFNTVSDDVIYVMMEIRQETDYVNHHIQKVVAFFAAMRAFSLEKQKQGHRFIYLSLDDKRNMQQLSKNITSLVSENDANRFEYQLPDEYRLEIQLKQLCEDLEISSEAVESEHFLTSRDHVKSFFSGKKTLVMESFYRSIRKEFNILMEGDKPTTGQWNYDAENRKKLPKNHRPVEPYTINKDVTTLVRMIEEQEVKTIGFLPDNQLIWPVTRSESIKLLNFFVNNCLENFGTFEDSMASEYWSIYHSRLSFAMNSKLLSPLEVVSKAIEKWESNKEAISIAQIEGFVRQIIGWREYMRGIYWMKMPEFAEMNFFENKRSLPNWYWNGKTKMNCMKHSIAQSLNYAYAHHIQRLMITGNFALLAGISPDELDSWYLGIYIDAIEWVEITNTRGMSQFADGGIVGTKPYAASANYIHKMSDYCTGCYYDRKEKVGQKACPFNSLYWHFHDRNRQKLEKNPRIGMVYRMLDKMSSEDKNKIIEQAEINLERIDEL